MKFWNPFRAMAKAALPPIDSCSLEELRRALGPWPWRTEWIDADSIGPLTETKTKVGLTLSLVMYSGYELFPARKGD